MSCLYCVWCGRKYGVIDTVSRIHQCQKCFKMWTEGYAGTRAVFKQGEVGRGEWLTIPASVLMIGGEKAL